MPAFLGAKPSSIHLQISPCQSQIESPHFLPQGGLSEKEKARLDFFLKKKLNI